MLWKRVSVFALLSFVGSCHGKLERGVAVKVGGAPPWLPWLDLMCDEERPEWNSFAALAEWRSESKTRWSAVLDSDWVKQARLLQYPDDGMRAEWHLEFTFTSPSTEVANTLMERFGKPGFPPRVHWNSPPSAVFDHWLGDSETCRAIAFLERDTEEIASMRVQELRLVRSWWLMPNTHTNSEK